MREYPNFYENIQEANNRLKGTVVLYGGLPFTVIAITDHLDPIFRVYLVPVGLPETTGGSKMVNTALQMQGHPFLGRELDKILEEFPDCGVLRKYMNSPKFNKFRPFPLGMCNVGTQVYYIERQPTRPAMHQGLTKAAIFETLVTAGSRRDNPKRTMQSIDVNSHEFRDCILGDHYYPREALGHLLNPKIANDALAFNREFAFCRGPLDALYLAYRSDIIGILPNSDLDCVVLGREFQYCREVVLELKLFNRIQ